MSISIVCVTYNSTGWILNLLNSIDKQSFTGVMQIILVDNKSNDQKKLRDILKNYIFSNKNITLKSIFRKENLGFGNSCNLGSKYAMYENLLFLNPDTILLKSSIDTILSHALLHDADICGGVSAHINSKKLHRTVFKIPSTFSMIFEFSNIGKLFNIDGNFYVNQKNIERDKIVEGVGAAFLLMKKTKFLQLNGFDEKIFMYLEDVDLCKRAGERGMKIFYCPHAIVRHEGGASSENKYKISQESWFKSREFYAKKHFHLINAGIIILIYKLERMFLEQRNKYLIK